MSEGIEKEIWQRLLNKTMSDEIVWEYSMVRGLFQTIIRDCTFRLKWKHDLIMLTVEDYQGCLLGVFSTESRWFWQNPPAKKLYRYLERYAEWIPGEIKTIPEKDILNLLNQSQ